jgi:hypothetical protein
MQSAINLRKQVIYERQQKHKALTEIQRLHSLGNASATTPAATRHGYDHKRINNKPSRSTPDCRSNNGRGANDSSNGRGANDSLNRRGDNDSLRNDNDDARGDNDNDDDRGDDDRGDYGRGDDDRGNYGRGDDNRGTNDGDCIDKATKNCSKTYQDNGSTGESNNQSKDQSNDQSKGQSSDQHDATAAADDDDENSCDTNDDHTSTGQSSDSDKMSSHRTGRNCKRRFHEISSNSAASATLSNTPAQQADLRCSADKQASV